MKTIIFTLLFILTFSVSLYSQSYFNVSMIDDREITVGLDKTQYDESGNYAEFDNLQEGSYLLSVFNSYKNGQLGSPAPLYQGYVKIPNGYAVFAVIDEWGNLIIYKKVNYNDHDRYVCRDNGRRPCKWKSGHNNWDKERDCYNIIKDKDFNSLVKVIKDMAFESTKIDVAKTAIDDNVLKTEHVRQILQLFAFESTKLELAKYAYRKTCDKGNYFNLYDVFAFESNVTELREYIKNNKGNTY